MRAALLFIALLAGCQPPQPSTPTDLPAAKLEAATVEAITGKVIAVLDGDTLEILVNSQPQRIRLNGIDAPEKGQPFGNNAKQALSDLAFGRVASVVEHDRDRYERVIGDVWIDGRLVNLELVARGLAWHYKQYSDDSRLASAENTARAQRLGLWSDPRHVAPWDWRKLSKAERDKLR